MKTITIDDLIKVPNNECADDNIIYPYKDRCIELSKHILVYKNLHKNCYSIKQSGKVVAHAERLCLRDVHFIVNEKERQKILIKKQKSVHAFMKGYYTTIGMGTTSKRNDLPIGIYYNPYKKGSFMMRGYEKPIKGAAFVIADYNGVKAAYTY